jgi:hypothetical protein
MDVFTQSTPITFMALFLARLLGDFPLQSEWISKGKVASLRSLILHGVMHFILAWSCLLVFTQVRLLSISNQSVVLGYLIVHLLIDKFKLWLTERKALPDNCNTFLLDQLIHLIVVAIAAILLTGSQVGELIQSVRLSTSDKTHILEVAIIYVAVIFGGGHLIRYLTKGLALDTPAESPAQLKNAGLYIGWIERFLVVTAIAIQSPALVGLILTGKSIARFPEFKEARFAEYFLIGTLLSVSLSAFGGIVLLELLYGTISLK